MENQQTITGARLALILACLIGVGCTTAHRLEQWPVLPVEAETDRHPGELRLGRLAELRWKHSTVQWGLAPLFSVRQYWDLDPEQDFNYNLPYYTPPALLDEEDRVGPRLAGPDQVPGRARQVFVLPPLFHHASFEDSRGTVLLPFYYNFLGWNEEEGRHRVWGLFPIYFGGRSDQRGSYHAVFPLGGTVKNMLGRDRIDFVLFPLYSHAQSGDHHSYTVLWPFINWRRGGGRRGWRVWPIVGRSKAKGEPPHWFFLWPFFGGTGQAEEDDRAVERRGVFPFYVRETGGAVTNISILGPIIGYSKNEDTGQTEYVAPWPFFRYGQGPRYSRLQFWPFYGRLRDRNASQQYYMWPFFRFGQQETDRRTSHERTLFLFYRDKSERWTAEDGSEMTTYDNALWPFWYYRRDEKGNAYLGALNLFGFPAPQGWGRVYSPLWDIYEYDRRTYGPPDDRQIWRRHRFLWGAVRYERDERKSALRVFPLFSVNRRDGAISGVNLLGGLLGYSDREDRRTFRVLFIPWTTGGGDDG